MADEKEDPHRYIGPTSQVETPINADVVAHGRDTGCLACKKSDNVSEITSYVSTRYVVMGVQHEHVYRADFARFKE